MCLIDCGTDTPGFEFLTARRRGARNDGAARLLPDTPPLFQVPDLALPARWELPCPTAPIVNSVGAENIEVTGECCEARLAIHQEAFQLGWGRRRTTEGPLGLKGTVDDFVAAQSTLDLSVSTSFNTNAYKFFGIK